MELHSGRLKEMPPVLSLSTALEYEHRPAAGLSRHGHVLGTRLDASIEDRPIQGDLIWRPSRADARLHLDFHRITEDAAEAVAMALVNASQGWTIVRRLRRKERGDWLLADAEHNHIAVEISGVDGIDVSRQRLREKLRQVAACRIRGGKAASVVELTPPRSRLHFA